MNALFLEHHQATVGRSSIDWASAPRMSEYVREHGDIEQQTRQHERRGTLDRIIEQTTHKGWKRNDWVEQFEAEILSTYSSHSGEAVGRVPRLGSCQGRRTRMGRR